MNNFTNLVTRCVSTRRVKPKPLHGTPQNYPYSSWFVVSLLFWYRSFLPLQNQNRIWKMFKQSNPDGIYIQQLVHSVQRPQLTEQLCICHLFLGQGVKTVVSFVERRPWVGVTQLCGMASFKQRCNNLENTHTHLRSPSRIIFPVQLSIGYSHSFSAIIKDKLS